MAFKKYLCGFFSQLVTLSSSVHETLQGTSLKILLIGFGASDVPTKLYNKPDPSGNGKKIEPCV